MIARNMAAAEARKPAEFAVHEVSGDLCCRIRRFLDARGVRGLDGVLVDVDGGTVTLRGNVASKHDRWLCVNCARRVAGVLHVCDELEVAKETNVPRRPR